VKFIGVGQPSPTEENNVELIRELELPIIPLGEPETITERVDRETEIGDIQRGFSITEPESCKHWS
jgi:hypothetical protein